MQYEVGCINLTISTGKIQYQVTHPPFSPGWNRTTLIHCYSNLKQTIANQTLQLWMWDVGLFLLFSKPRRSEVLSWTNSVGGSWCKTSGATRHCLASRRGSGDLSASGWTRAIWRKGFQGCPKAAKNKKTTETTKGWRQRSSQTTSKKVLFVFISFNKNQFDFDSFPSGIWKPGTSWSNKSEVEAVQELLKNLGQRIRGPYWIEGNLGGGFKYFFYFQPYLGKWSNLINIFRMGWNHQLVTLANLFGIWSSFLSAHDLQDNIVPGVDKPHATNGHKQY